jgi:hypothetical protein
MSEHVWFERFGLCCCKACGLVRRRDGTSNPCKGPVRVGLRNRLTDRFDPDPNIITQLIERGRLET